tara:strand:+ start:339 stop:689 length:351 start_codon:yes stop_codon:yes gene_type:complete
MNIKKLAKIITYIRRYSRYNCLWCQFNIIKDKKIIESFYLEGVYNSTSKDQKNKGFKNYYLPFFDSNDDFFIIENNTALNAAKCIKKKLEFLLNKKNPKILINVFDKQIKQKTFIL